MAMRAHSAVAAPIAAPARTTQRCKKSSIRAPRRRPTHVANGLFAKAVSVVRSSETTDAVYSDGDTTAYPTVLYAFREDGSCIVTNCATGKVIQKVKKGDGRLTFTADQEPVPAAVTEPVPVAAPVPEPVPVADPVTEPALESNNVVAAAVETVVDGNEARLQAIKQSLGWVKDASDAAKEKVAGAVDFAINGKPKEYKAEALDSDAQRWIDAWSSGASKEDLAKVPKSSSPSLADIEDVADDASWMAPEDGGAKPSPTMQTCDEDDQAAMESVLNRNVAACDIDEVDKNLAFADFGAKTGKKAAFFDLDGTLCASNIVSQYVVAKLANMPAWLKALWVPFYACKCLVYLIVDKFSRTAFNNMFFGDFAGMDASGEAKDAMATLVYDRYTAPRVFPAAVEAIAALKREGYDVVLVTGSVDFVVEPLAKELGASRVIANVLEEESGKFTGRLVGPAVADDEKRVRIEAFAEEAGYDLAGCAAYGDSYSDLPMLSCVGEPRVVSPSNSLRVKAQDEGWPVLEWGVETAGEGTPVAA